MVEGQFQKYFGATSGSNLALYLSIIPKIAWETIDGAGHLNQYSRLWPQLHARQMF